MGLIEKLASRERVRTALHALDDGDLRNLAIRYHIDVPGFRAAQAPFGLLLRALSRKCWDDRALRNDLEKLLDRRVGSAIQRGAGADPQALIADMRSNGPSSLASVLVGLTDRREDVRKAAEWSMNAFATGKRPLPRAAVKSAQLPSRRPVGPPQPDKRDEQLNVLRQETTRQERALQKLRDQLKAEKEKHHETRLALEEADRAVQAPPAADPGFGDALGERVREMERVLRDYAVVLRGSDRLIDALKTLAEEANGDEPSSLRKPTQSSALTPTQKIGTTTDAQNWPERFWEFLGSLATADYVAGITPLDCRGARTSRVLFLIPPGGIVAQYSDGERAARFLIDTTATTRAMLLWVRRELASKLPTS